MLPGLRILFAASLGAWLTLSSPIAAMPLPPPETGGNATLYLEILLNNVDNGPILPVEQHGDHFLMAAQDLRTLGLKIDPASGGQIDLGTLPGVTARYDQSSQRLSLEVPPALLPMQQLNTSERAHMPSQSDRGVMLNYDAFGQRTGSTNSLAFWSEQRFFGPFGVISNTGNIRLAGNNKGYLRYDTRYSRVDENRALSFSAGDIVSGALQWSTAVRMGGIQIGRNFRIRPDLILTPLPQFAGQAAVPSAVDLFIDGRKTSSQPVKPGPFILNDIPTISGAGRATVITTDALGRQVSTSVSFYVANELLRPGLSDFSVEAGAIRRNYGLKNLSYGAAAASGILRRGITNYLTLETHGELSRHVGVAGLGAVVAPGRFGVVNAAVSISKSGEGSGHQTSFGYAYSGRKFGISFQHQLRSSDFRDLGSFDLANFSRSRRSDSVVATVGFDRAGSLGLGYIDAKTANVPRTRLVTASYSLPIRQGANLFVSGDADLKHGGVSAQLRLMISFGRNGMTGGVSRDRGGNMLYQAGYTRSIPTDGGIGVNANVARSSSGRTFAQAQAVIRHDHAEFVTGASVVSGEKSFWAGASGSVVAMDGGIYTAPQIGDAFALISTDAPNVPVIFENQIVGKTDRRGHRLVTGVTAHQPARYAIDPMELSTEFVAPLVERRIAIRSGGGAIIKLPVTKSRALTLILIDGKGSPLDVGGAVTVPGQEKPAVIGWDGVVYLENPPLGGQLNVLRTDGKICAISLPSDPVSNARMTCS